MNWGCGRCTVPEWDARLLSTPVPAIEKRAYAALTVDGPSDFRHFARHAEDRRHHLFRRRPPPVRGRLRHHSHRPQGRPCRAQRRGQDHALPPDPGRAGAGGRRDHPAPARPHRRRGARGAVVGNLAAGHGAAGRYRTRRADGRGRDRPDPHRIAEIQARLADIDAWSAEGRASSILKGLGFDAEAATAALLGLFRRLADARGAGGRAVCAARLSAAGRTDQLPRP